MRLPLLSGIFNDTITAEDRAHPGVQLELRRRLRATMSFAIMATVPTATLIAAILWNHASHTGLLVFVLAVTVNGLQHWFTHLRLPVEQDWVGAVVASQLVGGAVWGALPLIAMPAEAPWQAFIGSFLLGVFASNLVFGSQFLSASIAFNVGLAPTAIVPFLRLDTEIGTAVALLLGFAAIFSAGLAAINRARDVSASVFGVRSAELAEGLQAEREHLARQVRTDQLTGLPNRAELMHRLEEALEASAGHPTDRVGLAYLDIDEFKRVNDSMGHRAGDLLLTSVTRRLRAALAPGELAARLSVDELTVLFPSVAAGASAERLGQRLLEAFARPFELDGYTIEVRASVGIAFADEGTSPDELLKHADVALYRAKAAGGGRVIVFDAALRNETEQSEAMERSFKEAFWNGRVVPYLQPFVDLATGRIVGAEALIRWIDGSSVRSAHAFMPVVHKLNMGAVLDESVLTQITDFNLSVEAEFGKTLPISINVSPNHIDHFLDRVDPAQLSQVLVEITEETTLPTLAHLSRSMARIQGMGGRVILDDFGVGYSSLERLSATQVDGLKIDRQFVSALDTTATNEAIVASIVELANRMDLLLVAEGIETEEQAKALRALGVDEGQGYLYSPAVSLDEFMEMLRDDVRLGPNVMSAKLKR